VGEVLTEIRSRLRFLEEVGLGYISLDRRAPTLSGGEAQRIRLASQIGSGLTGVLYVLDEPTIGLHPRDNALLLSALEHLRDLNNTVIVVEHDSDTLNKADYVVDFGPGAGNSGGEVVATGTPGEIRQNQASLTGAFLSGRRTIPVPRQRRAGTGKAIEIIGAREHNLKDIHAVFPLGTMTVVTGVSGSGKSTLVNDTLHRALACALHKAQFIPGAHDEVRGTSFVDKVILIDQEPIGSSSLSNPATYSGVFDVLRELFAQVPEAKMRGYTARRFSTNVPGGRCERCWGYGKRHIEMHFLPDVWVECEDCHGLRYNRETLEITFGGVSIGEVLQMPVEVALEHFQRVPRVRRLLQTLCDVGLGYMELGQSATTLSGGEAQRLKLASELARPSTGRTVYILDEPTTGLHFADTERLLDVLNRLVDQGNTVIMIEHNVLVIQAADWIIDLGPEGGDAGGYIVVAGTPEDVAACERSHTGAVLRRALAQKVPAVSNRKDAREAIAVVETETRGLE
ncbi:MAG TPA: excinuclease ABC subunit UvrA, partial [Candidatus Latescibacteria bacterium]|nr:excinuclease ABC subunit UvrA [Candidatus Latescibacterota bacterium]